MKGDYLRTNGMCLLLRSDQTLAECARREFHTAFRVKLLQDVLQVELHRVLSNVQGRGDLLVAKASGDEAQDLDLTLSEAVRVGAAVIGVVVVGEDPRRGRGG
jgi:hypothetical protein